LLGREALNRRYLINPAEHCLLGKFSEEEVLEKYAKTLEK